LIKLYPQHFLSFQEEITQFLVFCTGSPNIPLTNSWNLMVYSAMDRGEVQIVHVYTFSLPILWFSPVPPHYPTPHIPFPTSPNFLVKCTNLYPLCKYIDFLMLYVYTGKGNLPTAVTCSNTLCIPEYSEKSILEKKLKQAISLGQETFLIPWKLLVWFWNYVGDIFLKYLSKIVQRVPENGTTVIYIYK